MNIDNNRNAPYNAKTSFESLALLLNYSPHKVCIPGAAPVQQNKISILIQFCMYNSNPSMVYCKTQFCLSVCPNMNFLPCQLLYCKHHVKLICMRRIQIWNPLFCNFNTIWDMTPNFLGFGRRKITILYSESTHQNNIKSVLTVLHFSNFRNGHATSKHCLRT